jgi:hypothetical protein
MAVALFPSSRSFAADCDLEIDGDLLRQEVARVRRLVDPRCFVRSSTSAIGIGIVDGRYVEERLELDVPSIVHTTVELNVPAVCPRNRSTLFARSIPSRLRIATTINHEVGRVERTEKKVEAILICGPNATTIAVGAGNLIRLIVTYPPGGIGVR